MKTMMKILGIFFTLTAAASAQVVPAATGAGGAAAVKNLNYSFRYSESAQFSAILSNWQTSTASGTLDYANGSERFPSTLEYAGGYNWTIVGPAYGDGQFHHLFLSQGIVGRKWKVLVGDDVSYLPQAPTTGFSGIPGIGEPIGVPNPNPTSSQSILTLNTHVVDNVLNGEVGYKLSGATTLGGGGSLELLRYPNHDGFNTDTQTADANLERRFNSRNLVQGKYSFSRYSYTDYSVTFDTNAAMLGYEHQWTRNLTTIASAGPQWISSSISSVVPSSLNVEANAVVNYRHQFTSTGLTYFHGVNGGAGFQFGGESDTLTANLSRDFGASLTVGLTGGYLRNAALVGATTITGAYGGAQATKRIGRNLIVFANYTGTDQSSTSPLPTNAVNQLLQVVGFGVGYSSPREYHARQ